MKKTTATPIVTGESMNGKMLHIDFIDGKKYKLLHPGNRTKLSWEKECMNIATGIDREKYLDYAFEHCVIPDGHDFKPSLDNVTPKEADVWDKLLRRFLDGDIQCQMAEAEPSGAKSGRAVQSSEK